MVRSNAENYFMNETRSIFYTHTHVYILCTRARVVHDYPVTRPKREKRVYGLSVEYKCHSVVVFGGGRRRSSNRIGLARTTVAAGGGAGRESGEEETTTRTREEKKIMSIPQRLHFIDCKTPGDDDDVSTRRVPPRQARQWDFDFSFGVKSHFIQHFISRITPRDVRATMGGQNTLRSCAYLLFGRPEAIYPGVEKNSSNNNNNTYGEDEAEDEENEKEKEEEEEEEVKEDPRVRHKDSMDCRRHGSYVEAHENT